MCVCVFVLNQKTFQAVMAMFPRASLWGMLSHFTVNCCQILSGVNKEKRVHVLMKKDHIFVLDVHVFFNAILRI